MGEILDTLLLRASTTSTTVVLGTTMLGIAAGGVGVFALLRKRSLVSDALAHATLPGLCIAFVVAARLGMDGMSMPVLLVGAVGTGVLGVVCIHALLRFSRLREDASIGIVLSVFFGAGVVGLSYVQDPGNVPQSAAGLDHYIYGGAASMLAHEARLMALLAVVCVVASFVLLKEFAMVCFNDAFARVDGWPVSLIDILMMALIVLVTVAGLQAVGLIMVLALLIIPAVSARFWTDRLGLLIALAGMMGGASGYAGAVLSSLFDDQPAGAVIVLTSGAVFVLSMVVAPKRGVIAVVLRRWALRVRIAGEHLLELGASVGVQGSLSRGDVQRLAQTRGWNGFTTWVVLRSLRMRGEIEMATGAIRLTDRGVASGKRVARNHALWEQYLVSHADIAPSHVDWSVDQVEHVLSDELVAQLEAELAERESSRVNGGVAHVV